MGKVKDYLLLQVIAKGTGLPDWSEAAYSTIFSGNTRSNLAPFKFEEAIVSKLKNLIQKAFPDPQHLFPVTEKQPWLDLLNFFDGCLGIFKSQEEPELGKYIQQQLESRKLSGSLSTQKYWKMLNDLRIAYLSELTKTSLDDKKVSAALLSDNRFHYIYGLLINLKPFNPSYDLNAKLARDEQRLAFLSEVTSSFFKGLIGQIKTDTDVESVLRGFFSNSALAVACLKNNNFFPEVIVPVVDKFNRNNNIKAFSELLLAILNVEPSHRLPPSFAQQYQSFILNAMFDLIPHPEKFKTFIELFGKPAAQIKILTALQDHIQKKAQLSELDKTLNKKFIEDVISALTNTKQANSISAAFKRFSLGYKKLPVELKDLEFEVKENASPQSPPINKNS